MLFLLLLLIGVPISFWWLMKKEKEKDPYSHREPTENEELWIAYLNETAKKNKSESEPNKPKRS